jgi:hypothetical protein
MYVSNICTYLAIVGLVINYTGKLRVEVELCNLGLIILLQNSAAKVDQTKNKNTDFYVENPCGKNHETHDGVSL